jgi:hypothetical protein
MRDDPSAWRDKDYTQTACGQARPETVLNSVNDFVVRQPAFQYNKAVRAGVPFKIPL